MIRDPCFVVRTGQWLDAFTAVLPAREKYSKIVGLWRTEAGEANEVCHIWAYASLNARAEVRANALKDPAWQEFLGKGMPLVCFIPKRDQANRVQKSGLHG